MSLLLCCYKNKLKIKFLEHLITFNKKKKDYYNKLCHGVPFREFCNACEHK